MYKSVIIYLVLFSFIAIANGSILEKFQNYTRIFNFSPNDKSNDLWYGIIRDCSKKVTFSCIQKNAYTYLDRTFIDRENITIFDGLTLTKNNLDYNTCFTNPKDELVEGGCSERTVKGEDDNKIEDDAGPEKRTEDDEEQEEEYLTPLEEVTHALRKKAVKFLATRDYEVQLPRFIGGGAGFKISPKEIDSKGALIRIDFNTNALENQERGRIFAKHFLKKLKKELTSKLLMTLFILILLVKILKFKFFVVLPFLFGVGTAKKLFLKLLLFFVPAFGHVFKLCSSYYSSHATKHHHHHKVAHHHHHIPVPVPVYSSKPHSPGPFHFDHPPPSHPHSLPPGPGPIVLEDDFQGYDYAHPHIQYRKDIEELKEWGIEPYDENYDQIAPQSGVIYPGLPPKSTPKFPGPYGIPPQYAVNAKPVGFPDPKILPPHHPQSLAYAGYPQPLIPSTPSRQVKQPVPAHTLPVSVVAGFGSVPKTSIMQPTKQQQQQQQQSYGVDNYQAQQQQQQQQQQRTVSQQKVDLQQLASVPATAVPVAVPPTRKPYDDKFYGPIIERLDEIFGQLRFFEENCRERLVCSMYKNPALYSPHSNLISNELSRDPQELQQGNSASASAQRFNRFLNAARTGQDGGDCLKTFPCGIRTE